MTRIWKNIFTFEASDPHLTMARQPRVPVEASMRNDACVTAHPAVDRCSPPAHSPQSEERGLMFRQCGVDLVRPGEVGELDEDAANVSIRAVQQDRLTDLPGNCLFGGCGETTRHNAGVRGLRQPSTMNTSTFGSIA
jgi:hypothetical protein